MYYTVKFGRGGGWGGERLEKKKTRIVSKGNENEKRIAISEEMIAEDFPNLKTSSHGF